MSKDKETSWDNIPSLNLSLDKEDTQKDKDNRAAIRLAANDVMRLMGDNSNVIYVQVVTKKGLLKKQGILQNIHQNGICFIMPTHNIQKGDAIRIGLFLGKRPFQTNAIVRWATNDQVGVEYVNPKPEDVSFLSNLYSAKILNRF
ncbi:MAG: PilZ domain-containing protein [Desulfocapsa sp.]|nr:PilZ domain-containing protein [Desulfocapsa sp.]